MAKDKKDQTKAERDEFYEARRLACDAGASMNLIVAEHHTGGGLSLVQWTKALLETDRKFRELVQERRQVADRRLKEIEELIVAMRFLCATCDRGSSGVSIGGKALTVQVSDLFRTVIDKLQSLSSSDRGIVNGLNSERHRYPVAEMLAEHHMQEMQRESLKQVNLGE